MSKFIHNVTLHMSGHHIPPEIYLVNSDSGRQINFHIAEMDLTGYTAKIWVEKPSGLPIYNDCSIVDQVVVAEITDQMIAENGKSEGQIELTSEEDGRVTSFKFFLFVERKVGGDGVKSTSESTVLEKMVKDLLNANLAIEVNVDEEGNATMSIVPASTVESEVSE